MSNCTWALEHLWRASEFGDACYGCGFMKDASGVPDRCSGEHYEQRIADAREQIAKMQGRIDFEADARNKAAGAVSLVLK